VGSSPIVSTLSDLAVYRGSRSTHRDTAAKPNDTKPTADATNCSPNSTNADQPNASSRRSAYRATLVGAGPGRRGSHCRSAVRTAETVLAALRSPTLNPSGLDQPSQAMQL
jgi:hypothetical protein